jgi:type II secretory pathway pseudopilin PulG
MNSPSQIRRTNPAIARPSEAGFTLLAVMFLLAIVTVWLAVAAPKMARSIQHDREIETMHRGKQYIRGVQLYYRKFHAYPPNMDALVKTNEIRFLRKKYLDPMTGKDDWKPLMYGQNKQPIIFGFFGQPVAGSSLAGIGPAGGNNGVPGLSGGVGAGGAGGSTPCASGTLGSVFGCSQDTNSTATSSQSPSATPNGTDASGNPTSGTNGSGSTTGATDANGNPVPGAGSSGLSSSGSTAGQTFGGAGIIGVTPASPKESLLIYKKKNHYNEWEFDYDPLMETMSAMGGIGGTNGAGLGTNTNGLGTGTGIGPNQPGGGGTGTSPPQTWGPNGNLPPVGTPNSNN